LSPKGRHVEETPGVHKRLIAPVVDEIGTEDLVVAVADERVRAVPLVAAEVFVEIVGDGVPRDVLPTHPSL
jgi:hypothetical protein